MRRIQLIRDAIKRENDRPAAVPRAEIRLRKDMHELTLNRFGSMGTYITYIRGDTNKLMFQCTIAPSVGPYSGGMFVFLFEVPHQYPFAPPRVRCMTRVCHPNIELYTGRVLLPALEGDWKPVLSINTVVMGLQLLFIEPDLGHAVDGPIARLMEQNPKEFQRIVRLTLQGGEVMGVCWPHNQQLPQLMNKRRRVVEDENETLDFNGQKRVRRDLHTPPPFMVPTTTTSPPTHGVKRAREYVI